MGYLVVSRRINERLKIGDAEILIADVVNGKVDIAILAPNHIKIIRLPSHVEEAKEKGDFDGPANQRRARNKQSG